MFDLADKRILVLGHRGMVGSAIIRRLQTTTCTILTAERSDADLRRQSAVEALISRLAPDAIILAAAKVGGIYANDTYPAEFLYDNLVMTTNVVEAAHRADVNRMLILGSSCIYPKFADQPITEDALLTGPLEPTNEWYAIAKIAGIKLAQAYRRQYERDYISAMPTNLYGPGDNFDLATSHVLPALIRKVHEAKVSGEKSVTIWGSGTPKREFMHCDDCASALIYLLEHYSGHEHVNVGTGSDLSIHELALKICTAVGFHGEIRNDLSKPDGTPRKLMSSSRLQELGWQPAIPLEQGIAETYQWYLDNGQSQ